MGKKILTLILILLITQQIYAACPDDAFEVTTCLNGETGTCRQPCDLTEAKIQATIDASSDGDGVYLLAGTSAAWTTSVGWTNKNINIIGAGIDQTNIAAPGVAFSVVTTTKGSFRISGMTFSGTTGGTGVVKIAANTGTTSVKGWRLDHLRFNYSTRGGVHPILITGIAWGVIDNCIFDGVGYVAITSYGYIENDWPGILGTASSILPLNLGSDEAVYVEGCEFNFSANELPFVNDIDSGGRMVIRYNKINRGIIQTHAARQNSSGGLKYEIYNNAFTGYGFLRPTLIRSGTGVIFNNTVSGYLNNNFTIDNQRTCLEINTRCNGNDTIWDENTSGEYGWPCYGQIGWIGQILNQTNVPLYAWNNGDSVIALNGDFDLCLSDAPPTLSTHLKTTGDASPHAGGLLDYINNGTTPKPGYTAYDCPHPITGLTGSCTDTAGINGYNVGSTYWDVTPSNGTGYSASPSGVQTIDDGETTYFDITRTYGYSISASGCGGSLGAESGMVSRYTTGAITEACNVTVTATAHLATMATGLNNVTLSTGLNNVTLGN